MKIRTGIWILISLFIGSILFTYLLSKLNKGEPQKLTVVDSQVTSKSYFQEYGIPIVEFNNLEQLVFNLESKKGIQILDIFSHGEVGKITIGQDAITLKNIQQYQPLLMALGKQLDKNGHINILGCDIAKTDEGKKLVRKFAEYTGVSVAASIDPTGSHFKGGDWELEYLTHPAQFKLSFLSNRYYAYSEILYDPATYDPVTTDTDDDGVMDAVDIDDDGDGSSMKLRPHLCSCWNKLYGTNVFFQCRH
ncbi:DUF4347 domain-containing protein [Photobacterium leiognathi]|uniref:DUF4347 domain-containing protein n=1 Tax=Photobacterium leiognathi TaxID=553611 RepID=UPI0027396857|nr:DUF4347 domain-containing protein [Photobacterium leiognathi]